MSVHSNSKEAYYCDKMDSYTVKDLIRKYSQTTNHFTTQMCAHATGKAPSTLSRWIRELEADGEIVQELAKEKCPITGNSAMWFYSNKRPLTATDLERMNKEYADALNERARLSANEAVEEASRNIISALSALRGK